ncbi:transcriptional regulator [Paenibacillus larvae subsp. pulvifaciens]|uniref:Transcriptional regulator n=1 Tax=Paenibacillus larvae subsp. pulvifaciens TaxID=1477 RepID=A0A1V0UVE5_9BACL|nr:transcriptional regulator [Paenibacillus larvae subsp. pulvifaciens]
MNFSDRLKSLRKQHKVSQFKLAQASGMSERTFRKYESGEIEPTISVLILICNYFDVSADYLLGLSDNPKRN